MNLNIQVALPSRGFIYTRTIEGLLSNVGSDQINIVSEKPMPHCFNESVQKSLDKGADYIWMVEEDNELPPGILDRLLSKALEGNPIVTIDYTVGGNNSHIFKKDGEALWCGIGCTLIHKSVFEAVEKPWFEVDKHLNFDGDGYKLLTVPESTVGTKFGGHDSLFFYHKARPLGFKITVLDGHLDHFRCKEVPKRELNNGYYTVYSL